MPSAPVSTASSASATACGVLLPPAPARTGTRPFAVRTVISTTRRCSSNESAGFSPVVPHGTRKLIPSPICQSTSFASASSSSAPSVLNGVTSAVPAPLNVVMTSPDGRRARRPATADGTSALHSSLHHQFIEAEESFASADQFRCEHRALGEAFASAGAMRDLDQALGRVEVERVQAELRADARRGDRRIELAAAPFAYFVRDAQRRAARRVFFLRVMPLFH